MIPTIDVTAPPVFCFGCGREITYLFCVRCALARLNDADLVALARDIRRMSRSPILKTSAGIDCVICVQPIPAGTMAAKLAKKACAHVECVRGLRERLDGLLPGREPPLAGELPFDGAICVE
jgi:hypothetical protein